MRQTLEHEVQRSELEQLEQQGVEYATRMRKFAEATNTHDPGQGWVDLHH